MSTAVETSSPELAVRPVRESSPRRRGWLLSHPGDIHCVNFHLLVLASYAAAFWIYLHPQQAHLIDGWSQGAFVAACVILLGWISGIDLGTVYHNHVHRRVFRLGWLNRWFGRLWTFSSGWPSLFWKHAHMSVHHADVLGETDWTLPRREPDGSFESLRRYCLGHWPWRYAKHLWRDYRARRGGMRLRSRVWRELVIFLALWSIPFWIDPWMALWLWVLPQWFGNVVIMGTGMYVQHVGAEAPSEEHPYRHSNTFASRLFNLTMFNIGYHNEHHCHAQVHWTELPALHREMFSQFAADEAEIVPIGYYRAAAELARGYSWEEVREFD